ncbi:myeloid differentiation primary response protein MyD88 [Diachasma alloeum]|uniref:myeloid differentiation primary response protein MyD88 n=1 Tax=Diachasma alloeum TaxID=454923 RepID=UPI0007383CC6|nr:myeloid differentiation primary response protein MyD88 [Diachasma alloeum]
MVNFVFIPLVAMSPTAKNIFSVLLNPPKVLQTCDKCFRDWRGFAGVLGIGGEANAIITSSPDPTAAIFDILKTREEKITFEQLLKVLKKIDRWDVVDDTTDILEKDGKVYLERLQKGDAQEVDISVDNKMLTYDDMIRYEAGEPMQSYDAFLLYAEEDTPFANEIIENLEKKGNLHLCTKDRDLISRGERFESEVLMQLISERCTRLIVVLSPNFIKSPVNTFLMDFGQTTGLHERRRKIVPVHYQDCEIPIQMRHTVMLHYNRAGIYDFWERFRNCIRTVAPPAIAADRRIVENSLESQKIPELSPKVNGEIPQGDKIETVERNNSPQLNSKPVKKEGFFRFSKKKSVKKKDSAINLPSLSGLDKLEEADSEAKEKKRRNKGVVKRIKALVSRS